MINLPTINSRDTAFTRELKNAIIELDKQLRRQRIRGDGATFSVTGSGGGLVGHSQAEKSVISFAASNSSAADKLKADIVCDGADDDVKINKALALRKRATLFFYDGTYNLGAQLEVDNANDDVSYLELVGASMAGVVFDGAGTTNYFLGMLYNEIDRVHLGSLTIQNFAIDISNFDSIGKYATLVSVTIDTVLSASPRPKMVENSTIKNCDTGWEGVPIISNSHAIDNTVDGFLYCGMVFSCEATGNGQDGFSLCTAVYNGDAENNGTNDYSNCGMVYRSGPGTATYFHCDSIYDSDGASANSCGILSGHRITTVTSSADLDAGFTGTQAVVTNVNFTTETATQKTFTFTKGIVTDIT